MCTFIVLRYQYFYITNAQNAPLYCCNHFGNILIQSVA